NDANFVQGQSPNAFVANGPGEYEVKGVTIKGISTYHDDKKGAERGKNVIYRITMDGVNILHLGDLGHKLTDADLSEIETVDIVLIPVGGFYTIDAAMASTVIAQLSPAII